MHLNSNHIMSLGSEYFSIEVLTTKKENSYYYTIFINDLAEDEPLPQEMAMVDPTYSPHVKFGSYSMLTTVMNNLLKRGWHGYTYKFVYDEFETSGTIN